MPSRINETPLEIIAVDIFLERFQTRLLAGRLQKKDAQFYFSYNDGYLYEKNVISLGPEFPMTQKDFFSPTLFNSLVDRIPDSDNPAYESYCNAFGIDPNTSDPFILLSTIGRRGPSSFIFAPVYATQFTFDDFDKFRQNLGLSLQDAAALFDVSLSILQKIKAGGSSGKEVLKRLEIYNKFQEVLKFQIQINGKFLHSDKLSKVIDYLNKK